MNVLEVKQLQIMRDQRVIIDNLSFELPEGHRLFFTRRYWLWEINAITLPIRLYPIPTRRD